MAYLHVDVIPLTSPVRRTCTRRRCIACRSCGPPWVEPARADLAADKLQADYPNSEWAQEAVRRDSAGC